MGGWVAPPAEEAPGLSSTEDRRPGGRGRLRSLVAGQEGDRAAWLGLSKCDITDKTRSGKHHLTRSFFTESCAAWIYCCVQRGF